MTIKQQGGIFGRNPTFNDVEASKLDVDNIRVDGNTISSTNTNGDINLSPNGSGKIFGPSFSEFSGDTGSVIRLTSTETAVSGDEQIGAIEFYSNDSSSGGANVRGKISVNAQSEGSLLGARNYMSFYTYDRGSFSEQIKITHTGNLQIVNSGAGIDFSATSGTGTSELFDDYEEGTWTPVLTGSTSGTLNGEGRYVKVGSLVTIFCSIRNITTANKPSGNYSITGLPFTSISGTNPDTTPLSVDMSRITFDASKVFNAMILFDSTTISLQELTSNNSPSAITDANFVNGSNMYLRISGTYTV